MAKKIIIISSFPLFVVFAALALVFTGIGRGQLTATPADIEQSKSQIISLVETGKLDDANAAVDKLIADYNDNARLASTLVGTAGQYAWDRKYDSARRLYGAVIENHPNNPFTTKARLGLARLNVLTLIEEKNYLLAQQQIESMAVDFNSEPELPVALFHIGKEFTWQHRYTEATDAFDHAANKSSDTSLSQQAKLWSARANVCSLIGKAASTGSGQATDTEVVAAIDKMMSDFAGDAGLAEAVYWISKEYEWKKGTVEIEERTGWYDTPNSVYQKIMQEFGDRPYGEEAQWDQKRLAHRMKIFKLLKDGDQNQIDTAIETMVTDLKGRPEIAGELRWIAWGYEEQPDKGSQAKQMYKRIIREYPGTVEANEAVIDIPRLDIYTMLDSGDTNSADALLDKFIADFGQNRYARNCLRGFATKYYKTAMAFKEQNQSQNCGIGASGQALRPDSGQAKKYFAKSEGLWQQVIDNNSATNLGEAYFCAATCRQELGRWDDAIAYYQKVVDDYPDFAYVGGAQCAIGWSFEALRNSGKIPKEQANPIIEQAYTAVLTKYPDCYVANYAAFQLAGMSAEKGDKISAIAYYKKFLDLAKPQDVRIARVKETLSRLEGTSK